MILRRLRVRRFLGFVDETFVFAPGINVIVGPNESGKSSLRTAIRAALYGNPATTSSAVDAYRTWGTDLLPALDLEFEFHGTAYRLAKDFHGHKVFFSGGGEALDQHKRVTDRVAEFLGLSTPRVFQNTAEVAQAELERVQLTSLSDELSRVLGGGPDVDQAIKSLGARVREMEKGQKTLVREPGDLRKLEDRVQALTAQHQRVGADIAQIERKQQELAALRDPLAELEASLAAKQKLLDVNLETQELTRKLESLRREESMLSDLVGRIDQTKAQLAQLHRELEAVTAAGMPDDAAVQDAYVAETRIAQLEARMAEVRTASGVDEVPVRSTWMPWFGGGILLFIIGAIIAGTVKPVPGMILAGLGIVLAAIGAVRGMRHRAALQILASQRRDWESRLAALRQEHASAVEDRQAALGRLGGESLAEAERRLRTYRELVRNREEAVRVLAMLQAGTPEEALRERLDRLRTDIYGVTKELDAPDRAAVGLPAFETQKLRDEVGALTKKVADTAERAKRLAWEVEHRKDQAEDLAAVEEQLQEATDTLEGARRRHQVYRAALDGLLEARRQIERPVRDVVAGKAGDYLRILSGGRYDRIEVEKDSLQVWVWSADAGSRVEPKEPALSRGTIDLVYLSLRFALVTALAEGRRPPLLLDDPFITFDDTRRAAAGELLKELSKTHQVFLFTCGEAFDSSAGTVIRLPGRSPAAEPPVTQPIADRSPAEVPAVGPLWDRSPN